MTEINGPATDEDRSWLAQITLSEPDDEGRVVLSRAEGPVLRVPKTIGVVLAAVKNSPKTSLTDIAIATGISENDIRLTLAEVGKVPAVAALPKRPRLVQIRPPFTVQFTLLNPSKLLRLDGLLLRALRTRWAWRLLIAANVLGALVVAALWITPNGPLSGTLTTGDYGWLLGGFLLSMFMHEFAHAATLIAHGGQTRRLGFMFFYLAPAFFCDVRDIWSIDRRARVRVAFAGVLTQGLIAAVAGIASFFVSEQWAIVLGVLAFFNIIFWALNLIPFAKLDGYVALAGYRDQPNLREEAISAFHTWLESILYRRKGTPPEVPASVGQLVFGGASVLFPIGLVVGAVLAVGKILGPSGAVALWAELLLGTFVVFWLVLLLRTHAIRILRSNTARSRVATVWSVLAAIAIVAVTAVPLPHSASGGLFLQEDQLTLGLATRDLPQNANGLKVTLHRPGVLPGAPVGTTTAQGDVRECDIPLSAATPLVQSELTLDGLCFDVPDSADIRELVEQEQLHTLAAHVNLSKRTVVQRVVNIWTIASGR